MGTPVQAGEVFIHDTYFPIAGPVRRVNFAVTPNPVLFGDTSKAGQSVAMTQLTQTDYNAGSGIHLGNVRTDTNRVWTSDLATHQHRALTLPPFVRDIGLPAWVPALPYSCTMMVDFSGELWVAFNNVVGTWSGTAWAAGSDHICAVNPVKGIVWGGNLYLALTAIPYERRTAAGVWSVGTINAYDFADWDDKLWAIDASGTNIKLYVTLDGVTWTQKAAVIQDNLNDYAKLCVYRDSSGMSALYVHMAGGLWIYDATFDRFLKTEITYTKPGAPAQDWMIGVQGPDGRLYTTNGKLGLLAVQTGNPMVITPVGLDRDDGYPPEEDGVITGLAADENFVYMLTQDGTNKSSLRAYRGGWHKFWSGNVGSPTSATNTAMHVSSVGGKRVTWAERNAGAGAKVYYMTMPTGVYNPRFFSAPDGYQAGPLRLVTPWWPLESEVQQKIFGHLFVQAGYHSETESTTIEFQTDLNTGPTWTPVVGAYGDANPIVSSGLKEFFANIAGQQARWIRYRFTQQRGAQALTPIVEFYTAEMMRVLGPTYAYSVEIDLSKAWRGKTPEKLRKRIEDLLNPDVVGGFYKFSWQDELEGVRTHYGRISREAGMGWPGPALRGEGRETLSIIIPYHRDVA